MYFYFTVFLLHLLFTLQSVHVNIAATVCFMFKMNNKKQLTTSRHNASHALRMYIFKDLQQMPRQ